MILIGDAGGVEGRHLTKYFCRGLDEGHRERGAAAFAEAKPEIEHRRQAELGETHTRTGFAGAVPRDQVAHDVWRERTRDDGRRDRDDAVDENGHLRRGARDDEAGECRDLEPANFSDDVERRRVKRQPGKRRLDDANFDLSMSSSIPVPRPVTSRGFDDVKAAMSAAEASCCQCPCHR